jgi:hypothetical protein
MMNERRLVRCPVLGPLRFCFPLAALAASVAAHPAAANACTLGYQTIRQSYPPNEATGVPTNVVPILYTDGSHQDLLLRRADGMPVAVELTSEGLDGYTLRPLRELEPLTDYELVFGTARVPFETGEGPSPVPEDLTVPDFRATRVSYLSGGSCGRGELVCGATAASAGMLFEVRVGSDVLLSDRVIDPSRLLQMVPVYGKLESSDECFDVYARDVRGRRSAPLTLCGDEITVVEIGEVEPPGIDCNEAVAIAAGELPNYPYPSPLQVSDGTDAGCSFSAAAGQRGARSWALASALGLLVATLKRCRLGR